jgi:hypothetical protein
MWYAAARQGCGGKFPTLASAAAKFKMHRVFYALVDWVTLLKPRGVSGSMPSRAPGCR